MNDFDLNDLVRHNEELAIETTKAEIVTAGVKTYIKIGSRLNEVTNPQYDAFTVFSLDGLVKWIKKDVDKLFAFKPGVVRVDSPTCVSVWSAADPETCERTKLAVCVYEAPMIHYGTYMDAEDLNIMVQSKFIGDDNRNLLLSIVNNMVEENSVQTSDDGISQRVIVKSGVAEVDRTVFKNPAYLRPFRTFPEVEQPQSPFVVRFQEGKRAALFEADGGRWRVDAVQNVGQYLTLMLDDCNVVVIA